MAADQSARALPCSVGRASVNFDPLVRNPHLLTIAGNFWPRHIDEVRFPCTRRLYRTDERTTVAVLEHEPAGTIRGHVVFLHGLEGSAEAGYIRSFAQAALLAGFAVHRKNLRTCGGTETLCDTMYHSGLTSDTRFVLEQLQGPKFLVGFSLGGNVALKLAGELGETDLLQGVVAVSTPIDLARCVRQLDRPSNTVYARRFLSRLKARIARKSELAPELYSAGGLQDVGSIWQFDDRYTAPLFGFGSAANYYQTQSAAQFLDAIRVPTLVITAQDDPLVPFAMYQEHRAFQNNPALQLLTPDYGGHVGFISRHRPRFWVDTVALSWMEGVLAAVPPRLVSARQVG